MRKFLFRGKEMNSGQWVYGDLLTYNPHKIRIVSEYEEKFIVDPESVSEWIGLIDKNGKKIFAGDIIKFHKYRGEPDWVGIVEYEYCLYVAKGEMSLSYEKPRDGDVIREKFETQLSSIDTSTIEVLDNIHDNPELLKGGAE